MTDNAVSTLLLFLGERHSTALKCWVDPSSIFNPFPNLPTPSPPSGSNSSDPSLLGAQGNAPYVLTTGYECARAVIELLQLPLNSIVGAEGAVESLAAPIGMYPSLHPPSHSPSFSLPLHFLLTLSHSYGL